MGGTEVRVSAEVAGRVVESHLAEGTVVANGDLLVRIDDQDLSIRLAQATAEQLAIQREKDRRSEEHTSELQSLMRSSYAVFCCTKKKQVNNQYKPTATSSENKHNT